LPYKRRTKLYCKHTCLTLSLALFPLAALLFTFESVLLTQIHDPKMYENTDTQKSTNVAVAATAEQNSKLARQLSYCPVGAVCKMLDVNKFNPEEFKKFKAKKLQVTEERLRTFSTSLGAKNRNVNLNAMNMRRHAPRSSRMF
jgi:hypothetical protein